MSENTKEQPKPEWKEVKTQTVEEGKNFPPKEKVIQADRFAVLIDETLN